MPESLSELFDDNKPYPFNSSPCKFVLPPVDEEQYRKWEMKSNERELKQLWRKDKIREDKIRELGLNAVLKEEEQERERFEIMVKKQRKEIEATDWDAVWEERFKDGHVGPL